jgi:putative Mn2+ efflux pump MntP
MMGLTSIVELEKISKTLLFIFLAPLIGMLISMFITLVTIMRNVWLRIVIIILSVAGTWVLFNQFEQVKLKENLAKLYRVDKYEKEARKPLETTTGR